ncbi:MAG: hypothetical protein M0P91_05205 [Sulfuricurvum sp.]|jgi:hypothetical protein|nr:hypothetical protein [Sulfuricurvum sp.]
MTPDEFADAANAMAQALPNFINEANLLIGVVSTKEATVIAKASEVSANAITVATKASEVSANTTTAINKAAAAASEAANALNAAAACAALTNIAFGGFSVVDGELIVAYNSALVSIPSIVDGEFIITF